MDGDAVMIKNLVVAIPLAASFFIAPSHASAGEIVVANQKFSVVEGNGRFVRRTAGGHSGSTSDARSAKNAARKAARGERKAAKGK